MKISALAAVVAATFAMTACVTTQPTTTPTTTPVATTGKVAAANVPATRPTVVTSNNVDTVMNAFVVRSVNGQETLEPVTANSNIKAGDLVEYQLLLTNNGKDRVRNMQVALSLPQGISFTGYVSPSVGVQASVDGGRFVFMPVRASVNGVVSNVPFDQYQALRWTVEELGIGATAVVKYRATIN
ncbi:conserved repeat domain-containing protein [Moraxella cuniculi DSM 21768]|uniref:Conserved repeat domain-containing protein n=2 Tax=Moraxella cuniculi TaxID=34061 RepID=A0A1N7DS50_9GAMM|nr:DUF11 domain-containing protein [Moraxella cuniculi]SIR78571.1 conserved repeat domain-containing protein [Moraxella cuniculi DSM 21768]VEG12668.1 Uncharacterized protein conserved in bacteria [Moraxella cuniculi]